MFYLYLCFVFGYNCRVKLYKYPRYSSHTHEPDMIMSSYLERAGYTADRAVRPSRAACISGDKQKTLETERRLRQRRIFPIGGWDEHSFSQDAQISFFFSYLSLKFCSVGTESPPWVSYQLPSCSPLPFLKTGECRRRFWACLLSNTPISFSYLI